MYDKVLLCYHSFLFQVLLFRLVSLYDKDFMILHLFKRLCYREKVFPVSAPSSRWVECESGLRVQMTTVRIFANPLRTWYALKQNADGEHLHLNI